MTRVDFPTFCGRSMKSVSSNEKRVVDVRTTSSFYCRVQTASSSVGDEGRTVGGGSCSASGRASKWLCQRSRQNHSLARRAKILVANGGPRSASNEALRFNISFLAARGMRIKGPIKFVVPPSGGLNREQRRKAGLRTNSASRPDRAAGRFLDERAMNILGESCYYRRP